MPPTMLHILPSSNFWLKNIFLPFSICQRFFQSTTPEHTYRVPAEWTTHHRTLMAWPDRASVETDAQLHHARTEVANIAETIARYEPVWLYSSPANAQVAREWVTGDIMVKEVETEQLWMRDTGPLFVQNEFDGIEALNLNFNYWGSKLSLPRPSDPALAVRIAREQRTKLIKAPFVAEGGGLEVDGEGTLLTTESSILNSNRNPGATKEAMKKHFRDFLGIAKVIWLPGARGIEITDGHIDALARFAPNDTVLLTRPNAAVPAYDISWRIYKEAKEILQTTTNAAGRRLKIVEIEEALTVPYARIEDSGEQLATSYVNYYLPNGAVVMPRFGDDRTDEAAYEVLKQAWPGREVVSVKLDFLPWLGGGVHCATMQWPRINVEEEGASEGTGEEL